MALFKLELLCCGGVVPMGIDVSDGYGCFVEKVVEIVSKLCMTQL